MKAELPAVWREKSIEDIEACISCTGEVLLRAGLLGQVSADVDEIVGDHAPSDPAPDAVPPSIQRSPQPMSPFENTDAPFAAGTPFLKLLEPALFLPLLARRTLGVMARNRNPADSHLLGLGFVSG